MAGRRDCTAGYAGATVLLDQYPQATLAVIEDAGHALMHERPELLAALLGDWLERAATVAGSSRIWDSQAHADHRPAGH